MKVLIIENDQNVARTATGHIRARWPDSTVYLAGGENDARDILKSTLINLVVMDTDNPEVGGCDFIKNVHSVSRASTIILSSNGTEREISRGLEMGADDYIVKPFRPRELVARATAILRRTGLQDGEDHSRIVRGKLMFNLVNGTVLYRGQEVKLTPTESKLLYTLMTSQKDVLTPHDISASTWGVKAGSEFRVRTCIRRLRQKLNDYPPQLIVSIYREGYKFIPN